MDWIRSSRSRVAWLALFSLVCQLVLSFGHVHLSNFGVVGTWTVAVDGGNLSTAVPPSSPQKSPTGVPGDFCAICTNIGFASTLVVPDPPFVLAPSSFIQILPWSVAASEHAYFENLYFNARGPPGV
jgi:hypothetical protein